MELQEFAKMKQLPLEKAFLYIEPGPVVLITTFDGNKNNIMTISWTMVKDFDAQFIFRTGPWNYSYKALIKGKECVIAVPTMDMAKTVVKIGSCSGKDTDKFEKFKMPPLKAMKIKAPLIKECYVNIECRITDYIERHSIFVVKGINAWIDSRRKEKRLIHAIGDGTFVSDGEKLNYRKRAGDSHHFCPGPLGVPDNRGFVLEKHKNPQVRQANLFQRNRMLRILVRKLGASGAVWAPGRGLPGSTRHFFSRG